MLALTTAVMAAAGAASASAASAAPRPNQIVGGIVRTSFGTPSDNVFRDATSLSTRGSETIEYRGPLTLRTVLRDTTRRTRVVGARVTLLKRAAGSRKWSILSRRRTNAAGIARYVISPKHNARYEWTFAGSATEQVATSSRTTINVGQQVSIATKSVGSGTRGKRVEIYGTVHPAAKGHHVALQRKVHGMWRAVTSAVIERRTLPNGHRELSYLFSVRKPATGITRYRVLSTATSANAGGISAARPIRGN